MNEALERSVTNEEQELQNTTLDTQPEVTEVPEKQNVKLTKEQIVETLRDLIEKPVEDVKEEVDSLKQAYYKIKKAEIEEAKKLFVEQGNPEEQFQPEPDSLEEQLKELLATFKEKKASYLVQLEQVREENLQKKKEILEEIKSLTEDTDNINKHYNRFQQLQQSFKESAELPASSVNDLWKNYQAYVERFYDLLKINKELRDYDFKKNLEQKQAICESAEALSSNEDIIAAFKALQQLHNEWREIGPVAKDLREDLWNRFKDASTIINKKYQQYFEARKDEEQKNEDAKTQLCLTIEAIEVDKLTSFNMWDEKTKEIIALQEQWKQLGFAPRKTNNVLFERFRKSCDDFFNKKAEYFKAVKDELAQNLEKKKALCEKAEALKDSTDWRSTTDTLIALQKEWKTIGPVAKKYSDVVWKRFITACDYFFDQKSKQTSSQKAQEQENLKIKKEIIAKLAAIDETTPDADASKAVRELMAQWQSVGFVPFKEKDKIYREYQDALDKQFSRLNMNETRNRLDSFQSTVQQMASDQSQNKLYRERERLMRSYEQKKNELQTYENNMGFLNISSKSAGGLLKEMERKMQKLKEEMELIVQKIEVIDQNL
ncbi:MAG: DUF349 domain-containing protein [Coprobacter sp.]|jgi:hypothetical protein bfra3_00582|uniref:DUF349 domain-containing protein n=1 Tax=Barnesiella propionica TaxID=2981781 RepID=UPI000D78F5F2|nr:DUF349 domain-containing protein [Barnesiella propionica]MBO1735203.1 DUF349 domain-containing protein [Barnesiella sp. GGCC_0306]MBS7038535.1 DUF349 domain-containing protein [Bacteroidales bacterium]MCU6769215.1 DUF349 domain-containing protein [Barnesiella propionica]PWM91777.1 MAG: DUF349 domain-containing protein [Coprobacter sp.]